MAARGGRHVRPRGPRQRYSPGTEDERPQLGGGLGPDLLQRQVDQLGAREGDCVFELPLDEVAKKIAAHMRRPEQEIMQRAELLERCLQRATGLSASEVVRRHACALRPTRRLLLPPPSQTLHLSLHLTPLPPLPRPSRTSQGSVACMQVDIHCT